MNILNMIPIVGWLIAALICLFVAVPVHILWNTSSSSKSE